MHLPSAHDLASLNCCVSRGAYLYSADMVRAYRQLPLDPADCFQFEGRFFTDVSLSFGLRWAASHCQEVISLITRELGRQGPPQLYIDDFGGVTATEAKAAWHFGLLQALEKFGFKKAKHKSTPPLKVMVWLSLCFDTTSMTVSIPDDKLEEVTTLVGNWSHKEAANIHDLKAIPGKLFYVAQCCHPTKFFFNRMLKALRLCPSEGSVTLSPDFKKDLAWFRAFLPQTNGVFIIHEDRDQGPSLPLCRCVKLWLWHNQ